MKDRSDTDSKDRGEKHARAAKRKKSELSDEGEEMLDRILYFLFRKNAGLSLLALVVTAIAFTLSGCTCNGLCLNCYCSESGGCEASAGCLCEAIGNCNEKCDQSCGACHACNQCADNCINGCTDGCINGCTNSCNDSCDNCTNGCKERGYEYSIILSISLRDTQGQSLQNGTTGVKIWSAYLTRKEAKSLKKETFAIRLTSEIKREIFKHTGPSVYNNLSEYYEIMSITAGNRREAEGDDDLEALPFNYTIGYSADDEMLTITTPDWTDNHQVSYTLYAIAAVEELDYGKPVDVVIKYSENTGVSDERYQTKVGQPMPEIELKKITGFTSDYAGVEKNGKKYLFDWSKNLHLYNYRKSSNEFTLEPNAAGNGYILTFNLKYTINTYTLTGIKVVNGNVTENRTATVTHGSSLNESFEKFKTSYETVFNESGYYSAIWTRDKDGLIPYEYSSSSDGVIGDVTLYFHATTAITVTLFNTNGDGSGTKTLRFPYGAYVGGLDYPVYNPSDYDRFSFHGWYTDKDFKERFEPSERFNDFVLYAKWSEETTYTIRYFATLDAFAMQSPCYSGAYDRKLGLALPTASALELMGVLPPDSDRYTYAFAGWQIATETDGRITLSEPTANLEAEAYVTDVNLVAAFTHKIQLIIDTSAESLGDNPSDYTAYYGQPLDLPVPTRTDGMDFKGWRTDDGTLVSDGSGHVDRFRPSSAMSAPIATSYLIPVWETGSVTITFKWTENGETKISERIGKIGDRLSDVPTVSAPKGYDFVGWFDDGGNEFDKTAPLAADATYTARLEPKTFTITLIVKDDAGNETPFGQVTVRYGEKADLGTPPEVAGKYFMFWEDASNNEWSDSKGKMTKPYELEDDVTLYAYII